MVFSFPNEVETNFVLQSLDGQFTTKIIQAITLERASQTFHRPILDTSKFHINNWTEDYSKPNEFPYIDLLLCQSHQSLLQICTKQTRLGNPIVISIHLGFTLSIDMNSQVSKPEESSGFEDQNGDSDSKIQDQV